MNRKYVGRILALLAMVTGLMLASTHASPAYAGLNGQQLQVFVSPSHYKQTIQIEGYNQHGYWVKYPLQTCKDLAGGSGEGCMWTHTTGWWWNGTVRVTVKGAAGTFSCTKSVPKTQYTSNWYQFKCFG